MVEGLHFKAGLDKTNQEKHDDNFKMHEKIQELLLEMRLDRQDKKNIASKLAALETRITPHMVSHHTTPLLAQTQNMQHHLFIKTPFKMEIPPFDGTDALEWIFKINHF